MVDFTSALYLGMRHPHQSLRPWSALTTGRPAALEAPREAAAAARELAALLGAERVTLGTSTLHLFWDLFEVLAREPVAIYADAGTYPVARWGLERVALKGVPITLFPSHAATALERLLHRDQRFGLRPVVVADGLSPGNGQAAPLPDYLRLVRSRAGYLVIDDTQALGILGRKPASNPPFGWGGAGTPAWHGIEGPELIVVSSLAKGFGAPVAALAGRARWVDTFEELSSTRVHSSPPSLAAIAAAEHALILNAREGDCIRGYLLALVRRFRNGLRQAGLAAAGRFFPVQTLRPIPGIEFGVLHDRLSQLGVTTVLHRAAEDRLARLSFLITALHTPADIDEAIDALQRACAMTPGRRRRAAGTEPSPAPAAAA